MVEEILIVVASIGIILLLMGYSYQHPDFIAAVNGIG